MDASLLALAKSIYYDNTWQHITIHGHRISSNNSRADYLFFRTKKGAIIRGRRLFQILFTASRFLNILFYFPIKSKNNHLKEIEQGLDKCSKFGSLINFHCQYPRRRH